MYAGDEDFGDVDEEWVLAEQDEAAAFYAEAEAARWDDDPSPYAGDACDW